MATSSVFGVKTVLKQVIFLLRLLTRSRSVEDLVTMVGVLKVGFRNPIVLGAIARGDSFRIGTDISQFRSGCRIGSAALWMVGGQLFTVASIGGQDLSQLQ
jgi:hypothetical protein